MALRRGAKSKIGEARFGKCRLTITPPEFIKGVCEGRIFRKKKLAGEDPPDPLLSMPTKKDPRNEVMGKMCCDVGRVASVDDKTCTTMRSLWTR